MRWQAGFNQGEEGRSRSVWTRIMEIHLLPHMALPLADASLAWNASGGKLRTVKWQHSWANVGQFGCHAFEDHQPCS